MLLAGDTGGTKTSLALFSVKAGPRTPLKEATYASARYPNLEAIVREFLREADTPVESASFGVAGPVVSGCASITNLGWELDEGQLRTALKLSSVRLLNDLQAIGYGVPLLQPEDLHTLNPGQLVAGGALAVIAPGTGLGEAFLTWDGSRYHAHPTEGGHTDFAPANELQMGLLKFLWQRYGHVSYERVCSGLGIPNIYAYLKASLRVAEPEWLAAELAAAGDPTPVIVSAALHPERPSELCRATLDVFVSVLGSEAGNLALKTLATGGVFLAGGIPPRIVPALQSELFMKAFKNKGRFAEFMSRLPVHVILNPKVALFGAAAAGMEV
jgi:glucokinase